MTASLTLIFLVRLAAAAAAAASAVALAVLIASGVPTSPPWFGWLQRAEVDPSVAIESSGETDFALCQRGTEDMTLHIRVRKHRASSGMHVLRVLFRFAHPVASAGVLKRTHAGAGGAGAGVAAAVAPSDTRDRRRSRSLDEGFSLDELSANEASMLDQLLGSRDSRGARSAMSEPLARPGRSMSGHTAPQPFVMGSRAGARERANLRAVSRGLAGTPKLNPAAVSAAVQPRSRSRSHACIGEAEVLDGALELALAMPASPPATTKAPPRLTVDVGVSNGDGDAGGDADAGATTPTRGDGDGDGDGDAAADAAPAGSGPARVRASSASATLFHSKKLDGVPSPRHWRHMRDGASTASAGSVGSVAAGGVSISPGSHSGGSGGSGDLAAGDASSVGIRSALPTPPPAPGSAAAAPPAADGSRPPAIPTGKRHRHHTPKRRVSWWRRLLGRKSAEEEAEIRAAIRARSLSMSSHGSGRSHGSSHTYRSSHTATIYENEDEEHADGGLVL